MGIKDNLVALFVNSGTADCESLQSIYGPKVEANQTDLAYLKKVIDIMKMMKCTESEAYLQASLLCLQDGTDSRSCYRMCISGIQER